MDVCFTLAARQKAGQLGLRESTSCGNFFQFLLLCLPPFVFILLPLFFHCRSQQLIVRNAARQICSAGEQKATFAEQQGMLVCTFRPALILLVCRHLPFLHCRSQQLSVRNAARQDCPAGEFCECSTLLSCWAVLPCSTPDNELL